MLIAENENGYLWSELVTSGAQLNGYGTMIGKDYSSAIWQPYDVTCQPSNKLMIPLQFWWSS